MAFDYNQWQNGMGLSTNNPYASQNLWGASIIPQSNVEEAAPEENTGALDSIMGMLQGGGGMMGGGQAPASGSKPSKGQSAISGGLQGAVSGASTGASLGGGWGALAGGVIGGAMGAAPGLMGSDDKSIAEEYQDKSIVKAYHKASTESAKPGLAGYSRLLGMGFAGLG